MVETVCRRGHKAHLRIDIREYHDPLEVPKTLLIREPVEEPVSGASIAIAIAIAIAIELFLCGFQSMYRTRTVRSSGFAVAKNARSSVSQVLDRPSACST
jgi:hypothetical protein